MKWTSEFKHQKSWTFQIEFDENVGFYLYAYDKDRCFYDDLQDTLEWAKTAALEEFGVPLDSWKQAE